jgi:general secretion pathway protein D
VPGLSDLPVVGHVFASNHKESQQTDIILTLTPHIVRVLELSESDLRPFKLGREAGSTGLTELTGPSTTPRVDLPPQPEPSFTPAPQLPPAPAAAPVAPPPTPFPQPLQGPMPGIPQPISTPAAPKKPGGGS